MDMRNNGAGPGRGFRGAPDSPAFPGGPAAVRTGGFPLFGQMNGGDGNGGAGVLQYEPEDPLFGVPLEEDEVRDQAVPIADPFGNGTGGESVPGTCGGTGVLTGYPLSMVYAPDQEWTGLYDDEEALSMGTLFQALNLPFCPGCRRNGR